MPQTQVASLLSTWNSKLNPETTSKPSSGTAKLSLKSQLLQPDPEDPLLVFQ